jgi:hypothetical protein
MTENVTIHPAAIGHPADCYGCHGTGRTIGFGWTGHTCPGHRADCEPDVCYCDDEPDECAHWYDSQGQCIHGCEDELPEPPEPETYFGSDPWNDRHGDR